MALRKHFPRPPRGQERAALMEALAEAKIPTPSACGHCGATVAADDPDAEQTWRAAGFGGPYLLKNARSWRYHKSCLAAPGVLLARLLGQPPSRAHAEVARDYPVQRYQDLPRSTPADRGAPKPWAHLTRKDLRDLAMRVERRRQELTVPVPHESRWPCAICGRSHELADDWTDAYKGRPTCGRCSKLVRASRISGNSPLEHSARAAAWDLIPPRRVVDPFPLACEMPFYARVAEGERRDPWAYVVDLPPVPPTAEERLAALEEAMASR